MKIEELLNISAISLHFEAHDKEEALKQLAKKFTDLYGEISYLSLLRALRKREEVGSTGIGGGIAIPHAKTAHLNKTIGLLAVSGCGVEFKALDGNPVNIFLLMVYPERSVGDHLKALAKMARFLRDKFVQDSILRADSPDRVMQILLTEEARNEIFCEKA